MRATSHARLTVDGVGTKSRDLVQERDSDAEKETGRFIVFREKILWKQICNENTSKCERLKNIEENRKARGEAIMRKILKDSQFILIENLKRHK